jgi:hypothetical protein
MKLVLNNPYRIFGILVGASAIQQNRHISRIPRYLDSGDDIPEEFSAFSFKKLGEVKLSEDILSDSALKLNLDNDKMIASLFWFYNGNTITDEPALEALKDQEIDQVLNIWTKLISSSEVSKRNASAFSNLGTLYLSGVLDKTSSFESNLEKGISLKLQFLESEFAKDLKTRATDSTFKITNKELQILFLNQLVTEIEKDKRLTINKFIDVIYKFSFEAKDDFFKSYFENYIVKIDRKVEETKNNRSKNNKDILSLGAQLYDLTVKDLIQLKNVLGVTSLKYSSIADKVANEILNCGIAYFSKNKDSITDSGKSTLNLFRKAKIFATGNIVKQRCKEQIETVQNWIEEKPEREKQNKIKIDLEALLGIIEEFEDFSNTIQNATNLINRAKPKLNNIKSILGASDDLYLKLSTRIVGDAQSFIIAEVNAAQDNLQIKIMNDRLGTLRMLERVFSQAWTVTNQIATLDMEYDFKVNRFNKNREALKKLCEQIGVSTSSVYSIPTRTSSSTTNTRPSSNISQGTSYKPTSTSSNSGCYIATMAYGDYDHPQVMILRHFRDEVLDKSTFGKWFIKTYYHYSPRLVEKLKNQKTVNIIIRKALNQFIKLIK